MKHPKNLDTNAEARNKAADEVEMYTTTASKAKHWFMFVGMMIILIALFYISYKNSHPPVQKEDMNRDTIPMVDGDFETIVE